MTQKGDFPDLPGTKSEGAVEDMRRMAKTMHVLSCMILNTSKKFRVTIDCDPETGRYEIMREELPINQ